ncbi:MAG: hypothetical protein PHY80_01360 [Rickettsiales bacterium]|nr:hypothetical protein [Rickettsiales bacterium]
MIDYVSNTLDYLKNTIEGLKSGFIVVKDIIVSISHIIGTIADILGFIGFRVFILLITTAFITWLLNFVSPISRKTNYFLAVAIVLWIGITAKMPLQIVILKYILIMLSPFVLTAIVNFLVKNAGIYLKIAKNKILVVFAKIGYDFRKKIFKIKKGEQIGVLFDCDLPSINEIEIAKDKIKEVFYEPIIYCDEKISLTDNNGKIVFHNNLKSEQFIKSASDKSIKLLWFWGFSYRDNGIVEKLSKSKKIKQSKLIIGNSYNSQILNFLQSRWNWKIIYGRNLKDCRKFEDIDDILASRWQNLLLINDFEIQDGYFLKEMFVGGDFQCVVNGFGTNSQLEFKNKVLFFDCLISSRAEFYKYITHLKNFIVDNKYYPKAIILGKIIIEDSFSYADIFKEFSDYFKDNSICIPIFQCSNIDLITLNVYHIISYNMGKINLM